MPEKDQVQDSINKYVKGDIDVLTFEERLRNNGVNPHTVEIDKVIRSGKSGGIVSYTALKGAVDRYRNSKSVVDYTPFTEHVAKGIKNTESDSDQTHKKFSIGVANSLNDV